MQQTSLGSVRQYRVAVLVMLSSFVLFTCSGGTGEKRNILATVPLNSNSVIALEGSFPPQFTFAPDSSVFSPDTNPNMCQSVTVPAGICGNPVIFNFVASAGTTTTLFVLSRPGAIPLVTGGVTFGSCILTAVTTSFPAGQGPQIGDTITFSTCSVVVSANNVEVGGGTETGTITLMLTNAAGVSAASTPVTIQSSVSIASNGVLLLNGVNTGINTNVTGTIPK